MTSKTASCLVLVAIVWQCGPGAASEPSVADKGLRILSWNVSDDAYVTHPDEFRALLRRADPDVLLLDEVGPAANSGLLQKALVGQQSSDKNAWYIDFGASGGRQRGVIASRAPLQALAEFSSIVPYPEVAKSRILRHMSLTERIDPDLSMDEGIPVNAAVLKNNNRRLLLVIADLQCCGNGPDSWQEFRRRVEVREIRKLVRQVLQRISVDGVVLAGDFNLVNGAMPLTVLAGPYGLPHTGLTPVELYHLDGTTSWTWDGRGTRYPSNALDFQLYGPQALHVRAGLILDTEDLPAEELEQYGLRRETSRRLSNHRPLVVEYAWH